MGDGFRTEMHLYKCIGGEPLTGSKWTTNNPPTIVIARPFASFLLGSRLWSTVKISAWDKITQGLALSLGA